MLIRLILTVLSAVVVAILGAVVYRNNPKKNQNFYFFGMSLMLVFWIIANYLADANLQNSLLWNRLTFTSITMSLYFLVMFSATYPIVHRSSKYLRYPLLLVCVLFSMFTLSPFFIKSVTIENGISQVVPDGLYAAGLIFIPLLILFFIYYLFSSYKRARGQDKNRSRLLIIGFLLTVFSILISNLLLPTLTGNYYFAQLGALFTLFFVGFTAYGILKHKLFDIRAAVARSFTYVLTIALIGGVYGFVAFGLANLFLQNTSQLFQQSVYTILAVVLAFLFQPIRRLFEKVSNAIFYRGKYDAQQLINEIGRIIAGEIRLDQLSHKVIRELAKQMKIGSVDIVVLSEKSVHFQTRVFSSEQHNVIVSDLKKLGRLAVVADEISSGEKKGVMKKYGYSVSLALRTSEEFLGYLLLGEKKSGDIYNTEDLQTLKTIANELSVGLQNAKAFAEIQAFNVTLQQKVNEATKNLRHANEQLKDLDKAKDEFISMASHQLRTPLTTVKGYVSMLDEGDFGKISKTQRQPLEQALDGSNRMARLIDDLLNVSRMEAGRFFIDATELDLNKIVPEEIDQLQNLAKTKKVELKYIAPTKPIPVMHLDENKTRQVIMNLADNAVHYSQPPKGGGKVEVRLERDGDDIVYAVRDNGIGVPKDQQDKLFTKMFRARNAQEVRPDGTGLGLYLVKRVVEDQGGKLIFESEPGKGSMFGFRMPIHNKIVIDKKAQKALAEAHKNG